MENDMKKAMIMFAAAALLTAPAFASGLVDNTCAGAGNCNTDDSIHNTANGGAGGSATGGNASTGPIVDTNINNNSAKIERGAVDVDNNIHNSNSNKNSQKQKQKQAQHQSQSQSAYSESAVAGSGNSDVAINYQRNVPPAYAPSDMISTEVCAKGQSAGASGAAFSFSLGITDTDDGCTRRRNAVTAIKFYEVTKNPAFLNVSFEVMCRDDEWRAAAASAGFPCAVDRPVPAEVPQASTDTGAKVAALVPMQPIHDDK
jgi:hypothetical protein